MDSFTIDLFTMDACTTQKVCLTKDIASRGIPTTYLGFDLTEM